MLRHSRMLELGSPAPHFTLPDGAGCSIKWKAENEPDWA